MLSYVILRYAGNFFFWGKNLRSSVLWQIRILRVGVYADKLKGHSRHFIMRGPPVCVQIDEHWCIAIA